MPAHFQTRAGGRNGTYPDCLAAHCFTTRLLTPQKAGKKRTLSCANGSSLIWKGFGLLWRKGFTSTNTSAPCLEGLALTDRRLLQQSQFGKTTTQGFTHRQRFHPAGIVFCFFSWPTHWTQCFKRLAQKYVALRMLVPFFDPHDCALF